jgi:hypothetical protein
VLGILAACASKPPPLPPPPPKPPAAAVASCYQELDALGVTYQRERDFHDGSCGIDQNVRVDRSPLPLEKPALMSCSFAVTLGEFETHVVEPAAKRILGEHVTEIEHFGSYACRGERGGDASRLSQHAFGRAIDIRGFKLEDGDEVTVLRDWHGDGPKARFLHEVAKGACRLFSMVITPNHNSLHRDHIHVDTGPFKACEM